MSSTVQKSLLFETERPSGPSDTLWQAIQAFPLDEPGTALPFSRRLARDHLWTEDYAARVVTEYRRFLYLMATGIETVTPSDAVDEAWHLHLSYTRSYWDDLCGKVVRRPLHHDPTKGGEDEGDRFLRAYGLTLSRYRVAFRENAPADIWPDAEARFAIGAGYRTVRVSDFWIMRRLWSANSGQAVLVISTCLAFCCAVLLSVLLFPYSYFLPLLTGSVAALLVMQALHVATEGKTALILPAGTATKPKNGNSGGSGGCGGCSGCGGCGG